jgi:hypothetical protein
MARQPTIKDANLTHKYGTKILDTNGLSAMADGDMKLAPLLQ